MERLIKVKVFPDSNEEKIVKKSEDNLEVYVRAKPERGRANRETIFALACHFKTSTFKIRLIKGAKQRNKIFKIEK